MAIGFESFYELIGKLPIGGVHLPDDTLYIFYIDDTDMLYQRQYLLTSDDLSTAELQYEGPALDKYTLVDGSTINIDSLMLGGFLTDEGFLLCKYDFKDKKFKPYNGSLLNLSVKDSGSWLQGSEVYIKTSEGFLSVESLYARLLDNWLS